MRISNYLIFVLILTIGQFKTYAQESRFYVKLKSAAMQFAPDLIEECVSVKQIENCRIEKYILYRKRSEILDSATWQICTSGSEVSIDKNDAPYHRFKCEEGEQDGRIGQVKGKVLVKAIRDTSNGKVQVWEVNNKFDQRYRLVYNPEKKRIESQFEPFAQRHALQNFMFQDIPQEFAPLPIPAGKVNELKPGDALQVVYYAQTDSGSLPRQINDYSVLERDLRQEFPITRIAFTSTDLSSGITINNDTVEVQELSDGLFIGNNLAIPYNAFKLGFNRFDPLNDRWRCYMLPREDFTEPLLELVYSESKIVHGDSTPFVHYWNSELPYRLSWVLDFPLPFQEYDRLKAKVEYLKRGGIELGKKVSGDAAFKPGIRFFDETYDGFKLTLFVAFKGKYTVELWDASNQAVPISSPQSLNLKAGMQKVEFKAAKQADQVYKIVLKQVDSDDEKIVQEFVFLSRYF